MSPSPSEPVPSKDLFPGEPTAPWDRKDLAGPPLNEAAWNYELRSYYERWQRGARDEIENLRRENVRWENAHKILLAENERLRKECLERFDQARHFAELSSGKITPEPAADESLSLLKAVCQEANEYGGIAEETVQAIELYLQRLAQPPGDGQ